ncbi:MAG TPA: hypothetical protein VJJ23_00955 [Candidatus Nanoarchaeia archaeon]|nr:hypothetical protein [Candidatus Nanoarchaeia archaeon]
MVDKKLFENILKELNNIKDKEKKKEFLQKVINQTKDKEMIEKLRKLEKDVEIIRETRGNELLDMSTRKISDVEEAPKYEVQERREQTFVQPSNLEQVVGRETRREENQVQYGADLNKEVREFNYNPINDNDSVRRLFESPGGVFTGKGERLYEVGQIPSVAKFDMGYDIDDKNSDEVRRRVEVVRTDLSTTRKLEDFNKQYVSTKSVENLPKKKEFFQSEIKYTVNEGRM